jgi:hypothetical protein
MFVGTGCMYLTSNHNVALWLALVWPVQRLAHFDFAGHHEISRGAFYTPYSAGEIAPVVNANRAITVTLENNLVSHNVTLALARERERERDANEIVRLDAIRPAIRLDRSLRAISSSVAGIVGSGSRRIMGRVGLVDIGPGIIVAISQYTASGRFPLEEIARKDSCQLITRSALVARVAWHVG